MLKDIVLSVSNYKILNGFLLNIYTQHLQNTKGPYVAMQIVFTHKDESHINRTFSFSNLGKVNMNYNYI